MTQREQLEQQIKLMEIDLQTIQSKAVHPDKEWVAGVIAKLRGQLDKLLPE